MKRILLLLVVTGGAALLSGCATPPPYPSVTAEACRVHNAQQGLEVGIKPLFDKQELDHYFGTDMVSRGILPVLVVAENHSTNASYLLAANNCSLSQSSGFAKKTDLPSGNALGWAFGGGLISTAIVADAQSKRTGMAIKELHAQTVSPGQSDQGFAYFRVPDTLRQGQQLVATVRVPCLGVNQILTFKLPFVWER